MCCKKFSNEVILLCIIIFILLVIEVKKQYFTNVHLYEFIKGCIIILLILFLIYLYIFILNKLCTTKVHPEELIENNNENNNVDIENQVEVTKPPDGVHE